MDKLKICKVAIFYIYVTLYMKQEDNGPSRDTYLPYSVYSVKVLKFFGNCFCVTVLCHMHTHVLSYFTEVCV